MQQICFVGRNSVGKQLFAVRYEPGCLHSLPWDAEQFDCTVFGCNSELADSVAVALAHDVVRANTDWIATTGSRAQVLHDLIDSVSVEQGRQEIVGGGSPMTSWHDDALELDQMAEVASLQFGNSDISLVLVLGTPADFSSAVEALKSHLARD